METTDFQTLNELFLKAVQRHAKADAFLTKRDGHYEGLSSAEAVRRTAALGLALDEFGVRPGDRVALLSENREEWALADYAIMGTGAIDVPLYPTLPASDLEYILRDSASCGIVLSTADQLQKILSIKARLPELRFIMAMDPIEPGDSGLRPLRQAIQEQLSRTAEPEKAFSRLALAAKPQNVATIIYTSGTTGQPKGVTLTHSNIVSNIKACAPLFEFTRKDRLLSFLPLSHIFERMIEYFAFSCGSSIGYAENLESLPRNMVEVRPTIMAVVPRVLEKAHAKALETVRQGPAARQKLFNWALRIGWAHASLKLQGRPAALSLRLRHSISDALVGAKIRARFGGHVRYLICGSAPLRRELAEFFYAVGLPIYEGYGLTETSPVVAVNYPGAVKLGAVGPVLPGVEVKLSDEDEDSSARGREILVRGPNVSPGYYRLETENSNSFRNGWFYTGDLGELDAQGYLSITGRKKNLLKTSSGKYVSPEKIEGLFQGHPYVEQMLVLGDSRHFVAALIVPDFARLEAYARKERIEFHSREELMAHAEIGHFMQNQVDEVCCSLAPFEQIRQIALLAREFSVDSGELSPTQKVRRPVVEERYRNLIDEIYRRQAPPSHAAASPSG